MILNRRLKDITNKTDPVIFWINNLLSIKKFLTPKLFSNKLTIMYHMASIIEAVNTNIVLKTIVASNEIN